MIFLDALAMKFRNVKLREQNKKCVACGPECPEADRVTDVAKFDYADFCQTNCNLYSLIKIPAANTLTVKQFYSEIQANQGTCALIDVRPEVQFGIVNTNHSEKLKNLVEAKNI